MKDNKIVVGITHGDINSISYEVIIKSLLDNRIYELCVPIVYGSPKVAAYHRKALDIDNFSFNSVDFKGFAKASITTDEFTPEELQIVRAYEWDRINFKDKKKWPRIAEMNGITMKELNDWRLSTRRGLGINRFNINK